MDARLHSAPFGCGVARVGVTLCSQVALACVGEDVCRHGIRAPERHMSVRVDGRFIHWLSMTEATGDHRISLACSFQFEVI